MSLNETSTPDTGSPAQIDPGEGAPDGVMEPAPLPTRTAPDIRLFGAVNPGMLAEFFRQQAMVADNKALVFELSTSGGEADTGRRIADELRLWQEEGRELFFLGKTHVYSAGVTIMSAFPPNHRYLTVDTELLIHERRMQQEVKLDGALRGCRSTVQNLLAEIESGQRLEYIDFSTLVKGTRLSLDVLSNKVMDSDWYLSAEEAKKLGLIAGVV